jgi:hypothetical protein
LAFQVCWTSSAATEYARLKEAAVKSLQTRKSGKRSKATRAEGLFKQVHECVQKLLSNPRHPGLNTHKYDSLEHPYKKGDAVFEAYAPNATSGAYRVFWCYGPKKGDLTIIAITPHP